MLFCPARTPRGETYCGLSAENEPIWKGLGIFPRQGTGERTRLCSLAKRRLKGDLICLWEMQRCMGEGGSE